MRQGGSSGGDDALALVMSKLTRCRLSLAYVATDLTVLLLSLSYIAPRRIAYSLITVTLSSFLIDKIQSFSWPHAKTDSEAGRDKASTDAYPTPRV